MPTRPKLIGVTGGIGSGKSTVCKIFEVLGHKVYYADDRAKWLMNNEQQLKKKISNLFGNDAYNETGLNRSFISSQIFKNQELLQQLNGLVHPAVAEDLKNWVDNNRKEEMLFDEAALLFEIGSYKKMDATILVTAPEDLRISRVIKRDPQRTTESIKEIISQQLTDDVKRTLANFVIENDGVNSVLKQTLEIYKQLQ